MVGQSPQPLESPYGEAFRAIETAQGCTPITAYELYRGFLDANGLDPSIYLSMAITSGGFVRDDSLPFPEAMAKNADFGSSVAQQIVAKWEDSGIGLHDIMVPSDLGKVPGWNQADYLTFWAHVITGLDIEEATALDRQLEAAGVKKLPGFIDVSLPRDERWSHDERLIDTYVRLIETFGLAKGANGAEWPRNMQSVFLILDPTLSLGVNAERYLCHLLGLGEYTYHFIPDSADYLGKLATLEGLGADPMPYSRALGIEQMPGRMNHDRYWKLRNNGFHFRKGGFFGILDRIDERVQAEIVPHFPTPQTNEEALLEYYANN